MHFKEAKGLLSAENGMNLYRGCTHGCIYCDSRSTCYNIEIPFEDVEVKINAPQLLEASLRRKRNKCMISTGSMSDPYIEAEAGLRITRKCLALIDQYGFGLSILTKSDRILRDLDLLKKINEKTKCVVEMTLTTYDEELCKILEPHVCTTRRRFEVLQVLRDNGIPTVVWFSPLLPFINDTEENLKGILDYCIKAEVHGIICFGIGLTLRDGNRDYFYKNLDKHFPGLSLKYKEKYGNSYNILSDNNRRLMQLFYRLCQKYQIVSNTTALFAYLHQFTDKQLREQISLFDC